MLVYDRGLLLGSCAGEAFGFPLIGIAVTVVVAGGALLAVRRFGLVGLRVLPWFLLGAGLLASSVMAAAVLFEPITARIEVAGSSVAVASCFRGARSVELVPASSLQGRFVLDTRAKGPPSPNVELRRGEERVAKVWLGHPGLDLAALRAIAPDAASDYERWRAR